MRGEEIKFDLIGDQTFADVIHAIGLGPTNPLTLGSLRIGIHVQGFTSGESESFILTPAPGAFIFGMLGIGTVGLTLRKFAGETESGLPL